jgi:hypothetical protein
MPHTCLRMYGRALKPAKRRQNFVAVIYIDLLTLAVVLQVASEVARRHPLA